MLNNSTKNDVTHVKETFIRIRHVLTQNNCSQLASASGVLMLLDEMEVDSHPSGYPDPDQLERAIRTLRKDKFRQVREKGRRAPIVAEIQTMINWLKDINTQAKAVRPEKIETSMWLSRDWNISLAGVVLWMGWLLLQVVIILAGHFISNSDAGIIGLTIINSILLLISFIFKSSLGVIATLMQLIMFLIPQMMH